MGDGPAFGTDEDKCFRFCRLRGKVLRFCIKAAHDCQLAFTTADEETGSMFEVYIGGWDGSASAIIFNRADELVKIDTPDILSDGEFREFWVTFDRGQVRVGKGDEWDPFMECTLPGHVEVTHFGYTTAWGASGWWKFFNQKKHKTETSSNYRFEPMYGPHFTFSVACGNDAHLAFTTAPEETEPMYEIFIGGWANKTSAIRLNKDPDQTVVKSDTPDIVSCDEERYFWVDLSGDSIKAGVHGCSDPFLQYDNAEPFKPTYVGFLTSWEASGKWKLNV